MTESRSGHLVARTGGVVPVEIRFSPEPPWRVAVLLPEGREIQSSGPDLFDCLTTVRRELEVEGNLLCCHGARPDVFPSGMSRQMGGGRVAYRLRAGKRAIHDDLVDIFDVTECSEVVTVAEQEAAVEQFHAR